MPGDKVTGIPFPYSAVVLSGDLVVLPFITTENKIKIGCVSDREYLRPSPSADAIPDQ